jgi:hypothetical protein
MLLMQFALCAFILALDNAGRSMLARIAIMAMTTNNSIRVKPELRFAGPPGPGFSERDWRMQESDGFVIVMWSWATIIR